MRLDDKMIITITEMGRAMSIDSGLSQSQVDRIDELIKQIKDIIDEEGA